MLSDKIRNFRKSCGISQIELANGLGVSKQCISNWENDNIQPSIDMLIKIATFFNVTTDYMLDLTTTDVIDVTGLTESERTHVSLLVKDLLNNHKNN